MKTLPENAGLSFSEWLVIAEGVDANMGSWLKTLAHHARPEERRVLDALLDAGLLRMAEGKTGEYELRQDYDATVKVVLKEKRKEDMNWLAFSLGYLSVKAFRREDLEMAVDVLDQMKASGEVTRADIGRLGWMLMGASMQERIADHNRRAMQISRTQSRKMAKKGDIAPEDARLVKHVAKEGRFDLYYLQPVTKKEDIEARHRLLCKYGRGTEWCTAQPGGDYHRLYKDVGIFILHSDGHPKYQFVDCNDVSEDEWNDDEGDSIAQFMDVNDQRVESLTPDEQKFLKRNAELGCYNLVAAGFEDWDDFMSASDNKVKASSGSVAANVIIMAGNRAEVAVRRLGPALSRIESNNLYSIVQSNAWGADLADGILDGLRSLPPYLLKKENSEVSYRARGMLGLMTKALAASSDPKSKVAPLADFVGVNEINALFDKKKNDGIDDGFLKALLYNKNELKAGDISSIIAYASDLEGMLAAAGDKFGILLSGNEREMENLSNVLRRRGEEASAALSEFLEKNLTDLPASAVSWLLYSSPDKEAAAKRLLSSGLDDERTRMIFRDRDLFHLADDSHIRTVARGRSKAGGLSQVAYQHGGRPNTQEEYTKRLLRFLKNSDDLDGADVVDAIRAANQYGYAEAMAEEMPQEMIDMISAKDIEKIAEAAERYCSGGLQTKIREGCHEGRPLAAVLKRTKLHFPMRYAVYMPINKERDEVILRNLRGSDAKEIRQALDLAQDTEGLAEEVIKMRGGDISPGEVAALIGHSKDKRAMFHRLKGKIDSLHEPYEPYEQHGDSVFYDRGEREDWMDMLMSFPGSEDIVDDVLDHYRRPLRPMAMYMMINNAKDQKSVAEKIKGSIKALEPEDYIRLQSLMNNSNFTSKVDAQVRGLVDNIRNDGPPEEGDTVVAVAQVEFHAESTPEDSEVSWVQGRSFRMHSNTKAGGENELEYEVTGVDGEGLLLSPKGEVDIQIGIRRMKVDERWTLKAPRYGFIRPG